MKTKSFKVEFRGLPSMTWRLVRSPLESGSHVAILTSKRDLEAMIAALHEYHHGIDKSRNSCQRCKELDRGLTQLLEEAFSET
jgi:hypothetical protein